MLMSYIEFPKLGWRFEISETAFSFNLFGRDFSVKWYGILILIGFTLATIYALKRARQFDVDPDRLADVVFVSTLFAFVGARLYYVAFSKELSEYLKNPIRILHIWEGGLAIYGALIFALLTALWMCRVRKVNTLAAFDLAGLGFLIGQSIGRWGNFINQEAFGGNTDLPWGMTGDKIAAGINGSGYYPFKPVHPTFLYESLWCLLGFLILHIISKKAYKFKGQIFSLYLMWYGVGRFFIEGLRTDSLMLGKIRVSQLVAALTVLGGLVLLLVLRSRANQLPKDLFATETAGLPLGPETLDDTAEPVEGAETGAVETGDVAEPVVRVADGAGQGETSGGVDDQAIEASDGVTETADQAVAATDGTAETGEEAGDEQIGTEPAEAAQGEAVPEAADGQAEPSTAEQSEQPAEEPDQTAEQDMPTEQQQTEQIAEQQAEENDNHGDDH